MVFIPPELPFRIPWDARTSQPPNITPNTEPTLAHLTPLLDQPTIATAWVITKVNEGYTLGGPPQRIPAGCICW